METVTPLRRTLASSNVNVLVAISNSMWAVKPLEIRGEGTASLGSLSDACLLFLSVGGTDTVQVTSMRSLVSFP